MASIWVRTCKCTRASTCAPVGCILLGVLVLCLRAEGIVKKTSNEEPINPSSKLTLLIAKKRNILNALKRSSHKIESDRGIKDKDKKDKLQVLELFRRELEATDRSLFTVIGDFERTLNSGFHSIDDIKESCFKRLEDMRNVSLQVEEDFNAILALQKEIQLHHPSSNQGNSIMIEILHTLSHAADELEEELKDDVFDAALSKGNVEVETVVKLSHYHSHTHLRVSDHIGRGAPVLIDPQSNQYSLSRPQDTTIPHEDHNLLYDLLLLYLSCFVFGAVFSLVRAPAVFGYIFTGVLFGPSGCNWVKSVVQIETFGEFGVFLIMFVVGLEFSPEKLRKVWKISVYCGNSLLIVNVLIGAVLGAALGIGVRSSIFLAACLSLSSTPLAVRFLDSETHRLSTVDQGEAGHHPSLDYASQLLGILVMQDIQLGGIIALLPLAAMSTDDTESFISLTRVVDLMKAGFGVCLLLVIPRLLTNPVVERVFRLIKGFVLTKEGTLVAAIGACFASLLLADKLGVALELGCFIAGLTLGSRGSVADKVITLVEPVRDFVGCYFFVSVGFHIFPTFIKSEFGTILIFTFVAIVLKFVLSFLVIGFFARQYSWATIMMSTGLSQISEFSFVLGSRGRRFGIISREVYLLLLSATIVSLFFSPLLWKCALILSGRVTPGVLRSFSSNLLWWKK